MKTIMKKAFHSWKFSIASGMLVFLIFLSNSTVLAEEKNDYPYLIKVNRYYNTITVYGKDETGEYDKPVKAITCSVGKKGTPTRTGTFQTQEKFRWKWLMGDVYGQYSTRINGGMLFHSVFYYKNGNPATLAVKQYNKLGTAASHGCIRLNVADAKWLYDNCPVGTTVIIYDDKKSPGPLGKPETLKITATSVRWDPTDEDPRNPYNKKTPTISGVKKLTVSWGKEINMLKGVTAKSTTGSDITKKLKLSSTVNKYKAGEYKVTYSVTDVMGRTKEETTIVTVRESTIKPVFEGVDDHYVADEDKITRDYVLQDITAFCGKVQLNENQIKVYINKIKDNEYHVTYQTDIGDKVSATAHAHYMIDDEAPVFQGVSDRKLEPGQVPDIAYALSGVTVTDNFTKMDQSNITVTIEKLWNQQVMTAPNGAAEAENNTQGQGDTKDNTQGNVNENLPEGTAGSTQGNTAGSTPDNTQGSIPGNTPEGNQGNISANTPGSSPENTQENKTGNTTENNQGNAPENTDLEKTISSEEGISYKVTYFAKDEAGNKANLSVTFKY